MRDERKVGRRWMATTCISLFAASGALMVSNLSCGSVVPNACAQEACPSVAMLETKLMELEARLAEVDQKVQPLLAIARLQCGVGSVLAWGGTTWECTKTINGGLAINDGLAINGDLTATGNATVTGKATVGETITVTGATAYFGATPMTFSRASFTRVGTKLQYSENGVLREELELGDGTLSLGGGASAYIRYVAGGGTADAVLLFNIDGLRTLNCSLVHSEDDAVAYGLTAATDAGNGYVSAWGGLTKRTFVLSRQGAPTHVISENSNYEIACF